MTEQINQTITEECGLELVDESNGVKLWAHPGWAVQRVDWTDAAGEHREMIYDWNAALASYLNHAAEVEA